MGPVCSGVRSRIINDRRCRFCRIFIRRPFHSDTTRKTIVPRPFPTVLNTPPRPGRPVRRPPRRRPDKCGGSDFAFQFTRPDAAAATVVHAGTAGGRDSFIKTTFVVGRNYRARMPFAHRTGGRRHRNRYEIDRRARNPSDHRPGENSSPSPAEKIPCRFSPDVRAVSLASHNASHVKSPPCFTETRRVSSVG